ncbi:C39 family peptidase [Chondromyces apiculatus]|uniref:Peptidoglycan binding-like domain-containing protein n=1 Tax=Chondromyces apiculatus DSM 436 TaxID=1192034 RepID=A0A017TEG5_9BACT|nr:C39 family peptidase [Chondromyces apiculatus]EYF07215.1 Hypothetical protein CAP_0694 [Chondromyces apiculatus DSM 436]
MAETDTNLDAANQAASTYEATSACPCDYTVEVKVVTRAGLIPIEGAQVKLDGAFLGNTNAEGIAGTSEPREQRSVAIEAVYVNAAENLKRETFELRLDAVDGQAGTYTPGDCTNTILKIRDVLGTGTAALSGDEDFVDTYPPDDDMITFDAATKRFTVLVKMATLSLAVPYRSQREGTETLQNGAVLSGDILCMPTSTEMLLSYWGVQDAEGAGLTRNDVMQGTYDASSNPSTTYPTPWQRWDELRAWTGTVVSDPLSVGSSIPSGADGADVPSATANGMRDQLALGEPFIVSIVGGHIMCIRGVVVKHDDEVQWVIANDPYGNLNSPNSVYDTLDIGQSVGAGGVNDPADVSAVQDVLRALGKYDGPTSGIADDATIDAIRDFQGRGGDGRVDPGGGTEGRLNSEVGEGNKSWYTDAEGERNTASGDGSARGKHVYYNGDTESRDAQNNPSHLRFNASSRLMILNHSPSLTPEEVAPHLTDGVVPQE